MGTASAPLDLLRAMERHRAVALAAFVLIFGGAVTYVVLATPTYEASVQLLMEPDQPNVLKFEGVINDGTGRNDYYQTQYQMLRTRALARATIARLDLWNDPELARPEPFAMMVWPQPALPVLRGPRPPELTPTTIPTPTETLEQSRAVNTFLRRLTVTPVRNSRLITVTYESANPALAARVANALAASYIDERLRFTQGASKDATEWLGIQLGTQRRRVEAADAALQQYREQHGVPAADEPHVLVQRIADLNQALTRARTTRFEKEAIYGELVAVGASRTVEASPVIAASTVLQHLQRQLMELRQREAELAQQVGDRHPDLIQVRATIQARRDDLDAEVARRVDVARSELLVAEGQEQRIADALAGQRKAALALGQSGIEYGVLQQEAAGARELYGALLQRAKEADMVGQLTTTNMRIVDAATVPFAPAYPRTWLILVIALFAASTLAMAIPLALDAIDDRVREPEDVPDLGVSLLGIVPAVAGSKARHGVLLLNDGATTGFAESLRHISANLLFSSHETRDRTVLFTSAESGEGKSTTASNVAMALAKRGERVLLVDADLRDPRQHEIFGQPLEPGLASALQDKADLLDVARQTSVPGLYLASAGKSTTNPADLLGSARLRDALHEASAHFDWVLVDSPPAIAFADAALLGRAVSTVVIVINAQHTSRQSVRAALACLDAVPHHVAGAVLSRVDVRRDRSAFGQAYRRAYGRS
jgi:capsular exopolysaccharide synthesis family protein